MLDMKYNFRENDYVSRPPPYEKLNGPLITIIDQTRTTDFASNTKDSKKKLFIFGMDIGHLSEFWKFIICAGGVFFFYLIYGYLQELIFSFEGFKPFGWYLTLVQFLCYSIFGSLEIKTFAPKSKRRIPLKTYALLAFLTVGTMGLSNTSLRYLNYPTQVIFKCCKLIPVMFGAIIIQGKEFNRVDFIACVCMSIGLIFFTLADSKLTPQFNQTGVLLISLALCADAAIGNVQEKAMKTFDASNTEVVLYSYAIGFVYIFIGLFLSGGFLNAFIFCAKYPFRTYGYAVLFSLSGYLGITFVLSLIRIYGALMAVTEWCNVKVIATPLEEMTSQELDFSLCKFYAEVRREDGMPYSKSALISFKYAIERHLNSPPYNKGISLGRGESFKRSNKMLVSILRKQRREGHEKVHHKAVISEGDMKLLRTSGVFSKNSPWSLLRGVWFYIAYHWCRRGCEGLRELTPNSFTIDKDGNGRRYFRMTHEELTKNHPGGLKMDENLEAETKMWERDYDNDGFHLLEFYLSKVNPKCLKLFQYPVRKLSPTYLQGQEPWFENRPLGINKLSWMMKEISKDAHLSKVYTNHCVRATAVTVMSNANVSNRHIMAISGHRSEASLHFYNNRPSIAQYRACSDTLADYGRPDTERQSQSAGKYANQVIPSTRNCSLSSSGQLSNVNFQNGHPFFQGCSITNFNLVVNNNK